MMIGKGTMMYLVQLYKIKCVGLILAFLCAAVSVTGCAARDEAILLIPSEEAAEMEALEKAEQEADSAGNNEQPSDAKIPEPARQMIYVYVCGEVTNPGVVELEEGSRAGEALELAGGMTPAADPFYGCRERPERRIPAFSKSDGHGAPPCPVLRPGGPPRCQSCHQPHREQSGAGR